MQNCSPARHAPATRRLALRRNPAHIPRVLTARSEACPRTRWQVQDSKPGKPSRRTYRTSPYLVRLAGSHPCKRFGRELGHESPPTAGGLPLQSFATNQIWLEPTRLATELLVWTRLPAWGGEPAHRWEPKRLRLRLVTVAARVITTGRRKILRPNQRWP
ncbi:MAG TPA: transposase [Sporichthyaceae bacterium]|nr:transposase [Sporichthyaceae bacterium]